MTPQLAVSYEFDRLPLNPIEGGTNLLVVGPTLSGSRDLLLELLLDNNDSDGVIFISADAGGEQAIEAFEGTGTEFDPGRMCVIDCTRQASGSDGAIRTVGSPSDLTGIGIEFSSLYHSLHSRDTSRVRVGLNSVTTLLTYAEDFRTVYRFLHTLTSRIRTSDGLCAAVIDPDATDQQALGTIAQAFDGRIDVREEDGLELKVRGLDDQPTGWQSVEPR